MLRLIFKILTKKYYDQQLYDDIILESLSWLKTWKNVGCKVSYGNGTLNLAYIKK